MLIQLAFEQYIGGNFMEYSKYIDHTLLKPESTRQQIDNISEAKAYHFKSICVNPTR